MPVSGAGEESPGSTETRCRITSGGGDSRESATESKPPLCLGTGVRVKGCGKSAPRTRQRGRHGKPHREQGQIGAACRASRLAVRVFRNAARVGCTRCAATRIPDEWSSSEQASCRVCGQNPAYRPAGVMTSVPVAGKASYTVSLKATVSFAIYVASRRIVNGMGAPWTTG